MIAGVAAYEQYAINIIRVYAYMVGAASVQIKIARKPCFSTVDGFINSAYVGAEIRRFSVGVIVYYRRARLTAFAAFKAHVAQLFAYKRNRLPHVGAQYFSDRLNSVVLRCVAVGRRRIGRFAAFLAGAPAHGEKDTDAAQ